MNRKSQIGLVLTAFSGFAFAGVNCGGGASESSDEPVAEEASDTAVVDQTGEAAQALPGPQCVTLKRGVFGGASDSQVATSGGKETKNYGAGLAMIAGLVAPGQRRALVKFDMTAVPANLGVTSATLTLQARSESQGGPGNQLSVHGITSAWNESTVTWNTQPSFNAAIVASDQGGPGTHTFDVTALAQGWSGGPNNGVLLQQDAFYNTNFTTSEDAAPAERPALEVCYIPDLCSGVTCPAQDQCHVAGVCNQNTGLCSNPQKANGNACSDGNACTGPDTCQSGTCISGGPTCDPVLAYTENTAQYGNLSGGTAFNDLCPAGKALTGFSPVYVTVYLRGATPICSDVNVSGSTVTTSNAAPLPLRGAMAFVSYARTCPANQMIVGFDGRAGALVDKLKFICSAYTATGGILVRTGGLTILEEVGNDGGDPFPQTLCSGNNIANMARVRHGDGMDAFGLGCATGTY